MYITREQHIQIDSNIQCTLYVKIVIEGVYTLWIHKHNSLAILHRGSPIHLRTLK